MALRSRTRPVGKGRSHVLGMQALASALRAAGIDPGGDVDILLIRDASRMFFSADYRPPVAPAAIGRFHIVGGDVASADAAQARAMMATEVLPRFAAWAQALLRLPANAPLRMGNQQFHCAEDGAIRMSCTP
jgi:hypothetical protein